MYSIIFTDRFSVDRIFWTSHFSIYLGLEDILYPLFFCEFWSFIHTVLHPDLVFKVSCYPCIIMELSFSPCFLGRIHTVIERQCDTYCVLIIFFFFYFLLRFEQLPACVYEMEQLEILCAADNQINNLYVEGLCKLKRLATLDLHNNNIDYVPPPLGNMTQLRWEGLSVVCWYPCT